MRDGVNRIDGKHLNYVAGFEVVLAIAAFGVGGIDGEPPGGSLKGFGDFVAQIQLE